MRKCGKVGVFFFFLPVATEITAAADKQYRQREGKRGKITGKGKAAASRRCGLSFPMSASLASQFILIAFFVSYPRNERFAVGEPARPFELTEKMPPRMGSNPVGDP